MYMHVYTEIDSVCRPPNQNIGRQFPGKSVKWLNRIINFLQAKESRNLFLGTASKAAHLDTSLKIEISVSYINSF